MQIARCNTRLTRYVPRLNSHKCTFALILIGIICQSLPLAPGQCNCTSNRASIRYISHTARVSDSLSFGRLSLSHCRGLTRSGSGKAANWWLFAARYWHHNPRRQCDSICWRSIAEQIADCRSLIESPRATLTQKASVALALDFSPPCHWRWQQELRFRCKLQALQAAYT